MKNVNIFQYGFCNKNFLDQWNASWNFLTYILYDANHRMLNVKKNEKIFVSETNMTA